MSGFITTFAETLAAQGAVTFTATNNYATASSLILITVESYAGAGIPVVRVGARTAGSFDIVINNAHGTDALNGALVISYFIYNTA